MNMSFLRSVMRDVAGVVHHADVAGVEPAVGVDGVGRGVGILEVARDDGVAAHHDLTGLTPFGLEPFVVDHADLEAGDGASRGLGDGLGGVALAAHGDGAGGLGEPVGGEDGGEGELAAHAVDQLDRDDRGAGDGEAQAREVVVGAPGMVQDRLVEGGRSRQHGDALGGDGGEDLVHVEDRLGDDGRTLHETGDDARLVAEGVEERVDDEIAVAFGQAHDRRPRGEGAQRLRVGGHGSLGSSRRARGEDDIGEVVAGHALPAGALGPHVDGGADDTLVALHDPVGTGEEFAPPEDGDLVGVRHLARGALVVTE